MKHWKISESNSNNFYLVFNEKSIWEVELDENINIDEAIKTKSLNNIKSFRYTDFSEIIFVDNDSLIILKFTDKEIKEKEILLNNNIYTEIKNFIIKNLKGTEVKEYSILKQLLPLFFPVLIVIGLTISLYQTAVDMANGVEVSTSGRRALLKSILVGIADVLGPIGCLIIGGLLLAFFLYLIFKVIKHPKQGKIIKIKKFVELKM
ncbi:hypothetical protein [Tamlana sp. I1]|uniref:hypothetical protein n=1 Tax=Tamlana sp. I1 TaxID=2762061 RepID=UPI00188DDB06|nr:hypothetical protein [Tamlana sp. I1]